MAIRFKYADKVPPWLRNKYVITIIVFLLWLVLFDANNLLDRLRDMKKFRSLEQDREYYLNRIEEDRSKLQELRTNDENLEKFAREQYRMKKPDEEIYVIVTPEQERNLQKVKKD
jgi:cell division protein DivIC